MPTHPDDTLALLSAASRSIHILSKATLAEWAEQDGKKKIKRDDTYMGAIPPLLLAAEALYGAAELLAKGKTLRDFEVPLQMRIADAKVQEGLMKMAGRKRQPRTKNPLV